MDIQKDIQMDIQKDIQMDIQKDIQMDIQNESKCTHSSQFTVHSSQPTNTNTPLTPRKRGMVVYSSDFEKFWSVYPRRVGKNAAWLAWQRAKPSMPALESVLNAIEEQKGCTQWQKEGGQFIPHARTWIRQGGWDDEQNVSPLNGDADGDLI